MRGSARPIAAAAAAFSAAAALVAAVAIQSGDGSAADQLGQSAIASSAMFGLLALAGAFASQPSLSQALGLGRGSASARDVACLSLGAIGLSHVADWLLRASGLMDGSVLEGLTETIAGSRGATLGLLLLGLAVAPAIAEELLCRGLIQRGVQRHFGAAAGILVSSAAFSALHMDVAQSLFALVLGLYLGAVAFATGSTRAPICAHLVNNAASVLGTAYAVESGPVLHLAAAGAIWLGLHVLWRKLRGGASTATRPATP